MPYYQEWHQNDASIGYGSKFQGSPINTASGFLNVDLTYLLTYRTKPSTKNALQIVEMPREKADPYTIFIDQNRVKRDAAIARGFSSDLFTEDRGHPFELLRFKSSGSLWSGKFHNSQFADYHRGYNLGMGAYSGRSYPMSPGFAPVGWTDLPAYAQTAYAKAAPTPAVFDLGQFIGEAREGLPRFGLELLTKAKTFKGLGSDYLNVEFGWKPFISDLQSAGEALMGATTALLGPRGPLHRLRREDVELTSSGASVVDTQMAPTTWELCTGNSADAAWQALNTFRGLMTGYSIYTAGDGNVNLHGNATFSERSVSERWFEGSFSFIPKIGFNPDSYIDRLGQLVKTDITPSTLWELAPWSWLTDWFLKIGNTIAANEVASDNRIVSNYAYAMESREITRGLLFTGLNAQNYAGSSAVARQWVTTGKRRIRANPYGFKPMTTANLNTNQWLIMAALGLTSAGR